MKRIRCSIVIILIIFTGCAPKTVQPGSLVNSSKKVATGSLLIAQNSTFIDATYLEIANNSGEPVYSLVVSIEHTPVSHTYYASYYAGDLEPGEVYNVKIFSGESIYTGIVKIICYYTLQNAEDGKTDIVSEEILLRTGI